MKPKYYLYISKSKVDMLYDQLQKKKFPVSEIAPKISSSVVSVELGIKREAQNSKLLFKRTHALTKQLEKEKLIQPLENTEKLKSSFFYADEGVWNSGVCTWDYEGVKSYVVMKTHGDMIILLVGSLSNLIGTKSAKVRKIPSGSESAIPTSGEFIEDYLPTHVRTIIEADKREGSRIFFRVNPSYEDTYPFYVGQFCLSNMRYFHEKSMEVLFKVYMNYDLRKNMIKVLRRHFPEEQTQVSLFFKKNDLVNYRYLYIGSPLYTALA